MNIFRPKYRMIKERLRAFGEQIKSIKSEARYSAAFWADRLNGLNDVHTWEYVITSYLAYWCTVEEIRFIDEIFFKQRAVKFVFGDMYMSDTACYIKQERIMDCIIVLAVQRGLIIIDSKTNESESASTTNEFFSDREWEIVKRIIVKKVGRVTTSMRKSAEAMFYVITNNIPWRELPKEYGPWKTAYNKYLRWKKLGIISGISNIMGLTSEEQCL